MESESESTKPSGEDKTVDTPKGPMATGSLLKKVTFTDTTMDTACNNVIVDFDFQAAEAGVITDEDQVMVAADVTANVSTKYSVVVRSPDKKEPTVVTGDSTIKQTFNETLSKPAEKTAMQKYSDMDEDILSATVMEGKEKSSSSSSSDNESIPAKMPRRDTKLMRSSDEVRCCIIDIMFAIYQPSVCRMTFSRDLESVSVAGQLSQLTRLPPRTKVNPMSRNPRIRRQRERSLAGNEVYC